MYNAYALTGQLLAPWNQWARTVQELWSDPALPLAQSPFARSMVASSTLLERTTRRYSKPPFAIRSVSIEGRPVAVREEVVLDTPFCKLLHFARQTGRQDPQVLVVAPLSGHHASLCRDTVAALAVEHDVYLTDWVDARLVPISAGPFDLDDYIDLLLRFFQQLGPGLHVVAVCQPTVPVLAAVSLASEGGDVAPPQSMMLMAGPIDPRVGPTAPNKLAMQNPIEWFEQMVVHRVPFGEPAWPRKVYPGFLQLAAFISMNPTRHLDAHLQLYRDLVDGEETRADAHRRFYDDYLAVMDTPAEYYLQTVASVFQRHDLPRGQMVSRGRRVRPAAITRTALMTVEGENDDIAAPGQTFAAHALCSGIPEARKRHWLEKGVGHYGVFSGRRWREEILPRFHDFIRGK